LVPLPNVTRTELLSAKHVSERQWQVTAASGPVTMLPFTWLGSRPYMTYFESELVRSVQRHADILNRASLS